MSENKTSGILGSGLTFMQVLFLVFLILKLTGETAVASWSWWWVTSPLWIGFAIIISVWLLFLLFCGIAALLNSWR